MRKPLDHTIKLRIDDDQLQFLRKLEHRHRISFSEAIRVCIDHYIIVEAERDNKSKKQ